MIAPKIPLVRDGQILSTGLVNSLIGRTEYAADLLRQYRLIAGDSISLEHQFDGTRVNAELAGAGFNIVGLTSIGGIIKGFSYNGSTFTDIIYPGSSDTRANGIDGSNIVGTASIGGVVKGFLYNGSTFTDIIYPGATSTQPDGIDGSNIVGLIVIGGNIKGFLYNGSTFTDINYPG